MHQLSPRVVRLLLAVSCILAFSFASVEARRSGYKFSEEDCDKPERSSWEENCGSFQPIKRNSNYRISGGFGAKLAEFPSFALVQTQFGTNIWPKEPTYGSCGGTILSKRMILTSAHCLFDYTNNTQPLNSVHVMVGTIQRGSGKKFNVQYICVPEKFKKEGLVYDVAVLVLKETIQYDVSIQPACMPTIDIDSSYQAYAVGFGLTSMDPDDGPSDWLKILPVKKADECRYGGGFERVCYMGNNPEYMGDICSGDSGGPVYATIDGRQTVVAVTQGGSGWCEAGSGSEDVFMNTFKLNKTITDSLGTCRRL